MSSPAAPATAPSLFQRLLDELETEAMNFWQSVKNEAEVIGTAIRPEIVLLLSQFKTIAINTVAALAQAEFANLTGGQKQSITINTIVQAALLQGKTLAIADASVLAQSAYDAYKNNNPTAQ
jgi:hypothetical protein